MIVDDQIKWKLSDKECLVEWLASDWDHTSQKLTLVSYKKSVLFIVPIQLIGFGFEEAGYWSTEVLSLSKLVFFSFNICCSNKKFSAFALLIKLQLKVKVNAVLKYMDYHIFTFSFGNIITIKIFFWVWNTQEREEDNKE